MSVPEDKKLNWHMGPTPTHPDPGDMWCYDCGGWVVSGDNLLVCTKCGKYDYIDEEEQGNETL